MPVFVLTKGQLARIKPSTASPATCFDIADDCRAAGNLFCAGASGHWSKRDLVGWLRGPYTAATSHVSQPERVPTGSKTVTTGNTTTTTFETKNTSAAGHCQALAMPVGKGRIVVCGEAAMLSAQVDLHSGLKFGMNVPGVDNRQFVLNTIRWLVRELN